jgi:hypothetical protein
LHAKREAVRGKVMQNIALQTRGGDLGEMQETHCTRILKEQLRVKGEYVNVKITAEQATKSRTGSRNMTLLFL